MEDAGQDPGQLLSTRPGMPSGPPHTGGEKSEGLVVVCKTDDGTAIFLFNT